MTQFCLPQSYPISSGSAAGKERKDPKFRIKDFEFKEVASVPKICMALKNNPSLKLILSLFLYETSGKLNLQVI